MKIKKKLGRGSGLGGSGWRCERKIEVFEKIQKNNSAGSGEGGAGGGRVGWGVRMDVKAMLGVGGDVVHGGCDPRIEGFVQCTKRYCTILRK